MADGGEEAAGKPCSPQHSEDYYKLLDLGLENQVAEKLEEIYQTGKLVHSELDDRAIDALKEFPLEGAKAVLQQFLESNLEHVSNKSAFLCGIMKTYRQKVRALGFTTIGGATGGGAAAAATSGDAQASFDLKPVGKGPDKDKIKAILERTGYSLDVTTGQRKYGGPPPNWDLPPPPNGCEVFCGKIPRDVYEDELILLFEKCGTIWDLRLMMDPLTGLNRGYAFVTFTTSEAAQEAVRQLNGYEMKGGRRLKVNVSVPNLRLFVGNIPKSKGKAEIMEEFSKVTAGLAEVIIYSSPDDRRKNRGFCFLEYDSHKSASLAKRRLGTGRVKIFGCDIIVDWADPQEEPDNETMSKVKVLYCRNLTQDFTEEALKETFEVFGTVQRVKKLKDYAFIHFEERDDAVKAMDTLHGKAVRGVMMDISLAKPPSDKKKKEELMRAREKRLFQQHLTHRGGLVPPTPFRGGGRGGAGAGGRGLPFSRDYPYECGYGPYRGGYGDPYYNGYPYYSADYYYDYPSRGGRGRPSPTFARGGRGGSSGRGAGGGRAVPSERPTTPPGAQGGPGRWRGGAEGGSYPGRGSGRSSGSWKGRGGPQVGRSGTRGTPKTSGREEAPSEMSSGHDSSHQGDDRRRPGGNGAPSSHGSDSVAMGTWSSDTLAQQQQPGGAGPGEDTVWYQDSYGNSWS